MFLDRISENIDLFRRNVIVGIFLFLMVFSSFFSGEWNNWVVSVLLILSFPLVFFMVLLMGNRETRPSINLRATSPLLYLVWFILLVIGFSVFFSRAQYASLHQASQLVSYAIIFIVAGLSLREFRSIRVIAVTLYATGILVSLINIILFLRDPTIRAGGLLLNPNALGSYLLFSLPIGLTLLLQPMRKKYQAAVLLGTALIALSFLLTFSYTGWVSLVLPLVIFCIIFRRRLFHKRNFVRAGAVALLLLIAAVGIRYSSTGDLSQAVQLQQTISGHSFRVSFDQRWNFITSSAAIFSDNLLTGTGLNTFQNIYPQYAHTIIEQPRYAHNYYLQTAAELGLFGATAFIFFVVFLLRKSYRVVRERFFDEQKRYYLSGLALGLLASSIHALFDFGWQFPAVFILFWLVGGLLWGQSLPKQAEVSLSQSAARRAPRATAFGLLVAVGLALFVRGITLFLGQMYFDQAQRAADRDERRAALSAYERAIRFNPLSEVVRAQAEMVINQPPLERSERMRAYTEAEQYLRSAAERNSVDYFIPAALGRLYTIQDSYDEAIQEYQAAIKIDPIFHPQFYYNLAYIYYQQGKYTAVQNTITTILDKYEGISRTANPNIPTDLAFLNALLAEAYKEQGDVTAAIQAYESSLKIKPDFNIAQQGLSSLQEKSAQ